MYSSDPLLEKMSYKMLIKLIPKIHSSFMKDISAILV